MAEPSRDPKLNVSQDARGDCNTETGGALQKFVSAAGATGASRPLHFGRTIRILYGHGLSPESSVIPFLASARCIY